MDVRRPDWWKYPADCQLGRPLGPELVPAEWQECGCPPAQATVGRGHLVIRCGTDGCPRDLGAAGAPS